jgi:predicted house-cleaning noncanonical NTP pyrophosphatase (MazG superfamily)
LAQIMILTLIIKKSWMKYYNNVLLVRSSLEDAEEERMIIYNKLVRDKIPHIIEKQGKRCEIRVLADEEYEKMLFAKLQEEVQECLSANQSEIVEELADVVEVVYGLLKQKGVTLEEFEHIRLRKKGERGGFDDRLFLTKVWERESF